MNNLIELRKSKKLTQQMLADLLHIDQTAVSQWERGVAFPRADKIPILAKILNCTIDELYENNEKQDVS